MNKDKKISFVTLGCSSNQAETEIMSGILSENGYIIVKEKEDADIIVVNICTVKGEKTAIEEINKVQNHKYLIIAGCIPPAREYVFKQVAPKAAFVKTDNITRITEVVDELLKGNPLTLMGRNVDVKTNLSTPSLRQNNNVAIIPINNSCNDVCSFCGVKLIKGKLFSYPEEQIISSIKRSLINGCREVWITSQDTGAYGIDKEGKCLLPELINKITFLPFDFKLRVGMFNPMNIVGVEDKIIDAMKHPKVFKFVHIPLQSGSDSVLKRMKRRYSKDQFVNLITKFKQEIPNLTFATDIIVGFPGESESNFKDTIEVIKQISPQVLHISRFQEIPNTAATLLDNKIHPRVSKERSRILTKLRWEIAEKENSKWIDWEGECLVVEKNSNGKNKGDYIAHNDSYLQVIIKGKDMNKWKKNNKVKEELLGNKIIVKIVKTNKHYLIGELLSITEETAPEIVIRC